MDKFIKFLEDYLGEIKYGWSKNANDEELPFQVIKYGNGPFECTVTYSTLGLSKYPLQSYMNEKEIHQELIFVSDSSMGDINIPAILQQVGKMLLQKNRALLRGDVIGPYGALSTNSKLEALYSTMPVYFPDDFHSYQVNEELTIVMTWLIPITSQEALFIEENGWSSFEDKLEDLDPDLIDFSRESII
ncbi:suppressor of fused domain protein [Sutcliffiella deserti]|uniref:suppressor of fused domain protein n=1 Tax=Sutcliffiella deserti TaxID=2875501 RepID=UPI001CBC0E8C|nr:suppressor of fused domain protein [Sutcliffiella deserti]